MSKPNGRSGSRPSPQTRPVVPRASIPINSFSKANCAATGESIRCDPAGVEKNFATACPEVALR
ncbi:hypothetical protein CKO51_00850 [Rhodopirellula sp. SM50]|nr:hypothetical protein CKO51_00850 [Rhodopirellula sp. SM50]